MTQTPLRHVLFFLIGAGLAAATSSCFNGSDASGLPCENDAQCGGGQSCNADGYCGTTPAELCGNGLVDSSHGEECDDGEANADAAACKSDCTLQVCGDGVVGLDEACDDGPDGSATCTPTCTSASCGNGVVDPGEECDRGGETEDCTVDCTISSCGDGITNAAAGEDCDPGEEEETAACNIDCTAQACGDGVLNEAAGELCDEGVDNLDIDELVMGNDDIDELSCTIDCERLYFYNGANNNTSFMKMPPEGNPDNFQSWNAEVNNDISPGNPLWWSGPSPEIAGIAAMQSLPIDLSEFDPDVEELYLLFRHRWYYPNCTMPPGYPANSNGDGGNLKIGGVGMVPPALPKMDEAYGLTDIGDGTYCQGAGEGNPLAGQRGYTQQNVAADLPGGWQSAVYDLQDFMTSIDFDDDAVIIFEAGFDCSGDCVGDAGVDETTVGWYIDDIMIIGQRPG
ncbi:MAG: hypothetical protein H6713_12010 [Myxococcales bacterium]|nr:hypothetical protein [Myxococcales bacterium]